MRTVAHFERLRALRTGAQQTLSVSCCCSKLELSQLCLKESLKELKVTTVAHFERLRALRAPRGLLRTGRDGAGADTGVGTGVGTGAGTGAGTGTGTPRLGTCLKIQICQAKLIS